MSKSKSTWPDVLCPYCNKPQDIDHDDGYGYEEGRTFNQECADCGKTFIYETVISFDYNAEKADCLNGGEHDWHPTETFPPCHKEMECSSCKERRNPTPEERTKYQIPTPGEYYNVKTFE